MRKKFFLLGSFFLVCTVVASADMKNDKKNSEEVWLTNRQILQELPDSFLAKLRCYTAYKKYADKEILKKLWQTDRQILQELPDSSLLRCRCSSFEKCWMLRSGMYSWQVLYNEKLSDMIANDLEAAAKIGQDFQLFIGKTWSIIRSIKKVLSIAGKAWNIMSSIEKTVRELLENEPAVIVDAEVKHVRLTVSRLVKHGPRKK